MLTHLLLQFSIIPLHIEMEIQQIQIYYVEIIDKFNANYT